MAPRQRKKKGTVTARAAQNTRHKTRRNRVKQRVKPRIKARVKPRVKIHAKTDTNMRQNAAHDFTVSQLVLKA
jgi:hypothetical protein